MTFFLILLSSFNRPHLRRGSGTLQPSPSNRLELDEVDWDDTSEAVVGRGFFHGNIGYVDLKYGHHGHDDSHRGSDLEGTG